MRSAGSARGSYSRHWRSKEAELEARARAGARSVHAQR